MTEPLSLEELHSLLKPYNWDDFEATQDGYLPIAQQPADPEGISFYMRVGLHMKRPMQVIIAEGNFVRMRVEKRWLEWQPQFKTIDPKNPKESLYEKISAAYQMQQYTSTSGGSYKNPAEFDKEWCPAVLYVNAIHAGGSQQIQYTIPNTYTRYNINVILQQAQTLQNMLGAGTTQQLGQSSGLLGGIAGLANTLFGSGTTKI